MPTIRLRLPESLHRAAHRLAARKGVSIDRLITEALSEKLERIDRVRLARECAKLDRRFEQTLADEGSAVAIDSWPEY